MSQNIFLIILYISATALCLLISHWATVKERTGQSFMLGILCAILYILTGAVYRPRDVVRLYSSTIAMILLGGTRMIPVIVILMLSIRIWTLFLGPISKPSDIF